MQLTWWTTLIFLCSLLWLDDVFCQPRRYSVCETIQYRSLSVQLQNSHQCTILDKLQRNFAEEKAATKIQLDTLYTTLVKFQNDMERGLQKMTGTGRDSSKSIPSLHGVPLVRDCQELYANGITLSGVYPIRLPDRNIVNVWCDMDTSYGGWTVIQRRTDGSINFTRDWDNYAFGFGNVNSEYWLGNQNLHRLTNFKTFSIRFDIWDWEGGHAYALYDNFHIASEETAFQLTIEGYSGTAGDAMSRYHNGMKFSTIDSDNDEWHMSCAMKDQAAWWYRACGFASLNGIYVTNGTTRLAPDGLIKGVIWYNWKNDYGYSMKKTEIKIKPLVSVKQDKATDQFKQDQLGKGSDSSDIDSLPTAESNEDDNNNDYDDDSTTTARP